MRALWLHSDFLFSLAYKINTNTNEENNPSNPTQKYIKLRHQPHQTKTSYSQTKLNLARTPHLRLYDNHALRVDGTKGVFVINTHTAFPLSFPT